MVTEQLAFALAFPPMPTPRPRARVIAVPGRRPIASFYSPVEYKAWQKGIGRALAAVDAPPAPFEGPLEVELTLTVEKPKTTKLPHPRGDVDNYSKSVLDAITADGRFWHDDTQVRTLCATKRWGESGEIAVSIRTL